MDESISQFERAEEYVEALSVTTLTEDELDDLEDADSAAAQVSYSGQDFDVDGLVRRLNKGDIVIPSFGMEDDSIETAGFQRGFVWTKNQMDRFIESLLLGYPIPGLFLVRQQDKRYLVLDGQQRLRTLQAFKRGIHGDHAFVLSNVADDFKGLRYETLPDSLRRTFDDAFLQATVVSTNGTSESLDAVYQIFERLNAGGTQLTPHEIRVALYAGPLISELERLNSLPSWRKLYSEKRNPRLRDQELILRVLAIDMRQAEYSRPLKGFLNDSAGDYRDFADPAIKESCKAFERAVSLLADSAGPAALRKHSGQVNAAQSEAILVGLMRGMRKRTLSGPEVSSIVESLVRDSAFDTATSKSTADELVVEARVNKAERAFGGRP